MNKGEESMILLLKNVLDMVLLLKVVTTLKLFSEHQRCWKEPINDFGYGRNNARFLYTFY